MRLSPRLYAGLLMLSVLLVVIGLLATRGGDPTTGSLPPRTQEQDGVATSKEAPPTPSPGDLGHAGSANGESPTPPAGEPGTNLIAYVGLDGQVRTISPDGLGRRQVSPEEGSFTWPTWSPDARSIVFSGVVTDSSGNRRVSLFLFDVSTNSAHEIHVGEPGVIGLLAEGAPHYPMWSPDSRQLAFITVTSQGLTLFLDDLNDDAKAESVLGQGPLWMSWSPDSRHLMVHRADDHLLVDTLGDITVNLLGIPPSGYRVPAWNPILGSATIAQITRPNEYTVSTTNVVGDGIDVPQPILTTPPFPAMLWSRDGKLLAVASSSRIFSYQGSPYLLLYRTLIVIPQDETKSRLQIAEDIIAYFWSPDGTKIAFAILTKTQGVLRWMVLDVADGSVWPLVEFRPSSDQLVMLQFFDQYAYSHSLWSPDSELLVFAGTLHGGPPQASLSAFGRSQASEIIVVNASHDPSPVSIATGRLASWSPR